MIIRSFLQEERFLSSFFDVQWTIRDCYATWIRTWSGFWVGFLLIESNSGGCLFVLRLINSRHRAQFRYLLGSKWKYKVRFSRVSRGIQRRRHYAVICAERHASGHGEIPAYRVVICINSFNLEYWIIIYGAFMKIIINTRAVVKLLLSKDLYMYVRM